MPPEPTDWLKKLGESYSQIHFGPGVMGKTSRATLGLMGVWAIVLWRLSSDHWQNAFLMMGGCVITLVYAWWVNKSHVFAEKHPDLALLEGAQLIEYQRFEAAINGKVLPYSPPVPDPAPKQLGKSADEDQ
jgi:hypothetical protein